MFEFEDDPVYQFMLFEFVNEPEEAIEEPESTEITLEINITYEPPEGLEEDWGGRFSTGNVSP